ncbi:hypothetical protein GLYMA_04G101950v4 [Glycine max]|nr:hypothetical protein GLYMA_04G101950v4 [Glycine max]KAH1110757.1 hypothetical protein GYH30_009524 [Glycine max]
MLTSFLLSNSLIFISSIHGGSSSNCGSSSLIRVCSSLVSAIVSLLPS